MLSISDIKKHSFAYQKGGKFYESVEVDSFFTNVTETLDTLTAAYEKAKKENDELIRKISVLSGKLEDYRKDEDNIRSALLIAQRAAETVIAESRKEADTIIGAAKADAESATLSADEYVKEKTEEINSYLINVKNDYDEAISEANAKAEKIIKDAELKASDILTKANGEAEGISAYAANKVAINQKKIASMKKITSEFKTSVIDVMNQQIRLLESIEIDSLDFGEEFSENEEDEVYHPEYTSEDYSAETAETVEDEAEIEDTAENVVEETVEADAEVVPYNDVIEEITEESEEAVFEEEVEEENAEVFEEEKDYFETLMEESSSAEPEKKEAKNVFTPIIDSNEQIYRKTDEIVNEGDEDEKLKFGKDYDIFEEDDDSQGTFFGRFKKK